MKPYLVCLLLLATSPGVAQDRVGLSFSNQMIATSEMIEAGTPVTFYLVAFLADRSEGITGFSCRVDWNQEAIKDLTWQPPVETGRDGLISATFPRALYPVGRCVVLASAICPAAPADTATVWLVGSPYITGTVGMGRDVPLAGKAGWRLCLGYPDPDDLGPPGQPGVVSIEN